MQDLFTSFSLQVNNRVYIKNPESSALGRKIVESSINLIDKVGYEAFTFRKLVWRYIPMRPRSTDILKVNINYCCI